MPLMDTPVARQLSPPVAGQRPFAIESPHGSRTDEYYWLRDDTRRNPEVLGYLEANGVQVPGASGEGLERLPLPRGEGRGAGRGH